MVSVAYNTDLTLGTAIPGSGWRIPYGWVLTGRIEQDSAKGLTFRPRAKIRMYVKVFSDTKIRIVLTPQAGTLKVTLGGTVLGSYNNNSSQYIISAPAEMTGEQLLEMERVDGTWVLGDAGSNICTLGRANVESATATGVEGTVITPNAAIGDVVQFKDVSATANTTWDWDFGDGSAHSTVKDPTHVYTQNGEYDVILTTNLGTKKILVAIEDPTPQGNISVLKLDGVIPMSNTYISAGFWNVNHYSNKSWNFGDGTVVSGADAAGDTYHTFTTVGDKTVTFTAVNKGATATRTIVISPRVATPPTLDLSLEADTAPLPAIVHVTANIGTLPAIPITTRTLNFGDGTAALSGTENAYHLYCNTGTFTVTYSAVNADGTTTKTKSYTVTPPTGQSGGSSGGTGGSTPSSTTMIVYLYLNLWKNKQISADRINSMSERVLSASNKSMILSTPQRR